MRACLRRVLCGAVRQGVGNDGSAAVAAKSCAVLLVIFTLILLLAVPVRAEELPRDIQKILDGSGAAVQGTLELTLGGVLDKLAGWITDALREPWALARQAAFFLLLACGVGLLAGRTNWRKCIDVVCVLGFGTLCLSSMMDLVDQVALTAKTSQTYLVGFVPVYSGVALLAGQTAGATVYRTMFYAMSAFLSVLIEKLLLPVLQIYFCFAVSAAVWGDEGLGEAASLFAHCFSWLLKGCGTGFAFVLGLQNVLAGNSDQAALRLGKGALAAAVPVVGDAAAAAMSGVASAVQFLKGSLALAAIAALAASFVPVLLRCGLYWLTFSGVGIVASASGQKQCGQICKLFGEGARLCGAVLILYFFMVILSTALLLIGGKGGA